jgi:hypothetical protein
MRVEGIAEEVTESDVARDEGEVLGSRQGKNLVVGSASLAQVEDVLGYDARLLKVPNEGPREALIDETLHNLA